MKPPKLALSLLLPGSAAAPLAAAQNTDVSGDLTVTAWDVAQGFANRRARETCSFLHTAGYDAFL